MFFEGLETGIGLEIVRGLQLTRNDLLTPIALFFHFAGSGLFYVTIIGTLYWMVNKYLGVRLLFALIIAGLLSLLLKEVFARPRPYHLDDSGIIALVIDTSYGLPSGHTSMATVFWGFFAYWMRKRWITIGVVMFIMLMGWSRMYVGVHYPQDVIGGMLLGGVVLAIYVRYVESVVAWWRVQPLWLQLGNSFVWALIFIIALNQDQDGLTLAGLMIGAGMGIVIETHYVHFKHKDNVSRRLMQVVFGLVIAVGVLIGLDRLFDMIEPPHYKFVVDSATVINALQVEVGLPDGSALEVCQLGFQQDLSADKLNICVVEVTPLSAILRILRYAIFGIMATSIIPWLSIRLNLMEREEQPTS